MSSGSGSVFILLLFAAFCADVVENALVVSHRLSLVAGRRRLCHHHCSGGRRRKKKIHNTHEYNCLYFVCDKNRGVRNAAVVSVTLSDTVPLDRPAAYTQPTASRFVR